jgi:hypothetical protein
VDVTEDEAPTGRQVVDALEDLLGDTFRWRSSGESRRSTVALCEVFGEAGDVVGAGRDSDGRALEVAPDGLEPAT